MHFVDDIDLVAAADRDMHDFFAEVADIIHRVLAGGVDFDDVDAALIGDGYAGVAFAAGFAVHRRRTVERLGENTRRGGLADPARADKQISMGGALLPDGIFSAWR